MRRLWYEWSAAAYVVAVCLALALMTGCPVPADPKPTPIDPSEPVDARSLESLSYTGERACSRRWADDCDKLADALDAGEIKTAAALLQRIGAAAKAGRDASHAPTDKAFEAMQYTGDTWSPKAAAAGLRQIANGARRSAQ